MVRGEVKRAFNPEFLNRLDEMILFHIADGRGSAEDHRSDGEQINVNLVAKQIKISWPRTRRKYILEKT